MKIFLSYPSEHLERAREIKDFVRSVGLHCWFDKDSIPAGVDWDRERRQAQAEADLVLLLCGAQTTGRDGVYQREINEALRALDSKRVGGIYLIPLRLEDTPLPPELGRLQYVDYFDQNWRQKLAAGFLRAVSDLGETVSPMLSVAATPPDEGGTTSRSISEERPQGTLLVTWYQYTLTGDYWNFVNSEITSRALGGLYTARRHLTEWWQQEGSYWELDISEFHRKGQLVSFILSQSSYFARAAHPNHGVWTVNILGEEAGVMSASDLFGHSPDALKFLTEYVNLDLKRQYAGTGDSVDISHYAEADGWELYKHYSFNEAGMRLNLSPASGLPRVFGYNEVYVPWEHVGQFLTPVARGILLGEVSSATEATGQ